MSQNEYRAKQHYQKKDVAVEYDDFRFRSWYGKMSHESESKALQNMMQTYFESPGHVLDIPCGTGRLLQDMTDLGFKITGGDISDEMMGIAKKRYADNPNIDFQKLDGESMPFEDNRFDYLTSYRLMCHLPRESRNKVLKEMIRVTRKVLIVNYHFSVLTPVYAFNKLFRSDLCSPYPLRQSELKDDFEGINNVTIEEIKKVSWYDRSSSLVVLRKTQ